MNKHHGPLSNVEQHYHIQELIERQEKRTEDREYYRSKEKDREERDSLIKDSKFVQVMDFYCGACNEDFKGMGIRLVEQDWSNTAQNIAFYRSKCFKGHWSIRLITDKFWDAYWFRSKRVHNDRGKHHNALIQPHETGFNLLYGRKNK